jgi:hypothetical protein
MNMPGFTAEASLYKGNTHYEAVAILAGLWRPGQLIQPAARPIFYCSMKGCCIDLRDVGLQRICCNGDECGPHVFV